MKTITRGDPEKTQGMFIMGLRLVDSSNHHHQHQVSQAALDVKEFFFIHTYDALVDFLEDFQKTRSGKPTRRMLAEIKDWNPTFDLQRATKDERLKRRRAYTINWLYDLVNLLSSIVVQRNTMRGEKRL